VRPSSDAPGPPLAASVRGADGDAPAPAGGIAVPRVPGDGAAPPADASPRADTPSATPLAPDAELFPDAKPAANAPAAPVEPPRRRIAPATWAVVLALIAVGAAWLVWARLTATPSGPGWGPLDSILRANAAAQVGKPAPAFTLPDPNGVTYTLDDFRGQVVLVNFWATWCEPCREEMPELDQLARDYRDAGLRVLAVNVLEDGPKIREFGEELELDLPLLADRRGEAYKAYNVQALPSTYVIDAEGVIRDVRLGVVTRRYLDSRLPGLLPGQQTP
jgi:cytochrome c biogenesis protein CcmG/thiol:disulfide interchange protein DsbE